MGSEKSVRPYIKLDKHDTQPSENYFGYTPGVVHGIDVDLLEKQVDQQIDKYQWVDWDEDATIGMEELFSTSPYQHRIEYLKAKRIEDKWRELLRKNLAIF